MKKDGTLRVELVCVGTELLGGKVNTHAAYLAGKLEGLGLALARETTVGDAPSEMEAAFRECWRRSDLVICSGGLGPTFDDVTREAWARVTGRPLRFRKELLAPIRERFRRRGLRMPPMNRRQAFVLSGADVMPNPFGTAPGQLLARGSKTLALFPGPARELYPMSENVFLPWLRSRLPPRFRETRVYRIFGTAESAVDERLRPLVRAERSGDGVEVTWGILAHSHLVDIKVSVSARESTAGRARLKRIEEKVRARFGKDIFGMGEDVLEAAVGRLLSARGETLAVAESCTGGLLAQKVTAVPGSSGYFLQGMVTYSNESKRRLLGVPAGVLERKGAVSRECAEAMARGCRERSGADWSLSITGVAGPEGGSLEKPVGLVYGAVAGPRGLKAWERRFSGGRREVREQAALWALNALRLRLSGGRG